MKKITIAVGSQRGPKLNAVTEALQLFSAALAHDTQFEVVGVEAESGVSHTPASRDELMRGARQRAEALQERARQGATHQFIPDRKSTRLNSSHTVISYAVFCLKKKKKNNKQIKKAHKTQNRRIQ